jgi:organic hydroperoxide reductase OsmC/OhrA
MASHVCTVEWKRAAQAAFTDQQYSRAHRWRFDGGAEVPGSSSPHNVKLPFSDPAAVDPEEAFVAAVSSCHMLWFLSLAAERGFVVDSYVDAAEGRMRAVEGNRKAMTEVVLRPALVFSGTKLPADADVDALHHEAHRLCYIANSIRSEVTIDGQWRAAH